MNPVGFMSYWNMRNTWTPADDAAFQVAFARFDPAARTVNEDYERMQRAVQPKRPPVRCIHGLTELTCAECYLRLGGYRGSV